MRQDVERCVGLAVAAVFIITFSYKQKNDVSPPYGRIFYKLGMECGGKCPVDQQIKYFKKAVHYDPNLSPAYYQLAVLSEKKGNYQKAWDFYRMVTKLDHMHNIAYLKSGLYYFQKREIDYALRCFLQAFKYRERDNDFHESIYYYYLARSYELKKDYEKAVETYRQSVGKNYKVAYSLTKRGMLYHLMGNNVVAFQQVELLRQFQEIEAANRLERYLQTEKGLEEMIE